MRRRHAPDALTGDLFPELPLPPPGIVAATADVRALKHPVWTEDKAKLIARYLQLFVFVTRSGTCIDGFAGRQNERTDDGWALEQVLANKPRRLRRFYVCDKSKTQVKGLEALRDRQPPPGRGDSKREIEIFLGDFNKKVHEILSTRKIDRACFCLLDQRTFECRWSTVEALARHRPSGQRIELFYFLPIGWIDRAIHETTRNRAKIDAWWGGPGWTALVDMSAVEKAQTFQRRFLDLGYKHVLPFPIFDRGHGNRIMFYMILATDHDAAPKLMWRAYDQAVADIEGWQQISLPGVDAH